MNVTGELGEPAPGTNEEYTLTDSDKNTTTVDRIVTVTNQLPEITGLDDIVINEGEGSGFDFADGVTATDLEDGNLTKSIQLPTMDLSSLTEGDYSVEYTVTDSDKNTVIVSRKVIVLKNNVDNEVKPEETPDVPNVPGETPDVKPEETPDAKPEEKPEVPEETPGVKPEETDTPGQAPDVKPEAPIVSENTSGNQHQSSNITLQQSNKVNTLPATGNVVGSSLLASIGGLLAGVGIKLSKKKRK
ncbi:immunoglobulin-like domain-containing protein [uncultured Clostridium sp.]|uniref:immunoglobulin-like domain-containing protein n=1 Tax=uncultured Clostridium sp. TaxID=59620 RepID=UPI0027DD4366|nr:immunoglobulin-like domain-containing protein [uncultured Clostridium sp.]